MTTALAVLAGLLLVVVLAPFAAELLRTPTTVARMAEAPGEIAHLPQGPTHYRWSGPEDGPIIVCIHGLSTPSYIFAATERCLTSLGFRVLTYDLYGRGYSARASGRQTAGFFVAQLKALLKHQDVHERVSLLGFSMGAQIAAAYAAKEDGKVARMVFVAPAGLVPTVTGGRSPLWTAPLVGDWMTRVAGGVELRRELIEHRSIATVIPNLEDRQAAETRLRGFLPALLSSRRHLLSRSSIPHHKRIANDITPVLAIWGTEDPVIPLTAMGEFAKANPDAHHVQIRGAGHNLLQTHPKDVAEALTDFLRL